MALTFPRSNPDDLIIDQLAIADVRCAKESQTCSRSSVEDTEPEQCSAATCVHNAHAACTDKRCVRFRLLLGNPINAESIFTFLFFFCCERKEKMVLESLQVLWGLASGMTLRVLCVQSRGVAT